MAVALRSNFTHLKEHDEQLLKLGMLAERYFAEDPNTCLLKLRQLTETLAQMLASSVGMVSRPAEGQYQLLHHLRDHGILPNEMYQLFTQVRLIGNDANHALKGTHHEALADRIEACLTAARAQVERLPPATLSKAFRGDLVPQDPNDEPASKLVERLQSAPLPKPSRKR